MLANTNHVQKSSILWNGVNLQILGQFLTKYGTLPYLHIKVERHMSISVSVGKVLTNFNIYSWNQFSAGTYADNVYLHNSFRNYNSQQWNFRRIHSK